MLDVCTSQYFRLAVVQSLAWPKAGCTNQNFCAAKPIPVVLGALLWSFYRAVTDGACSLVSEIAEGLGAGEVLKCGLPIRFVALQCWICLWSSGHCWSPFLYSS